jgi:hypothetical protein
VSTTEFVLSSQVHVSQCFCSFEPCLELELLPVEVTSHVDVESTAAEEEKFRPCTATVIVGGLDLVLGGTRTRGVCPDELKLF